MSDELEQTATVEPAETESVSADETFYRAFNEVSNAGDENSQTTATVGDDGGTDDITSHESPIDVTRLNELRNAARMAGVDDNVVSAINDPAELKGYLQAVQHQMLRPAPQYQQLQQQTYAPPEFPVLDLKLPDDYSDMNPVFAPLGDYSRKVQSHLERAFQERVGLAQYVQQVQASVAQALNMQRDMAIENRIERLPEELRTMFDDTVVQQVRDQIETMEAGRAARNQVPLPFNKMLEQSIAVVTSGRSQQAERNRLRQAQQTKVKHAIPKPSNAAPSDRDLSGEQQGLAELARAQARLVAKGIGG